MNNWEGAELMFYFDGESHSIDLSDIQFTVITKILGLQYDPKQSIVKYLSDDSLKKFMEIDSNPLKLIKKD